MGCVECALIHLSTTIHKMKFDRGDAGSRALGPRAPHRARACGPDTRVSAWIAGRTRARAREPHEWRLSSPLRTRVRRTMVVSSMDTYEGTSAAPTTEVAPSRQSRILVIDDDRYVRTLLCDLLEAWGYAPDGAADGREGLNRFEPGRYDVVMTDLGMPGLTGLDVVAGVRDRDTEVSVIMFTAFTGDLAP